MKIIAGIPAFNEGKNIAKIISDLKKIVDEVIVCDDGSNDETSNISKEMGAIVIQHKKNQGYGAAIVSIFSKAKEMDVDILFTFDGDGQHRIEDVKEVTKPIKEGIADIVIGSRFLGDDSTVPKYRKFGIKTITSISNSASELKLTDSQSGFRAYNRRAIQELNLSERGMGVSTEILIKASRKGLTIKEVPIKILYDGDTSTHNAASHGISVILSTMKFVSIEHPLKFYGITGLGFLIIGLFFIVWTIQGFTDTRQIITNVSLIGIGSTLLGTILMVTAIILYSLINVIRENK